VKEKSLSKETENALKQGIEAFKKMWSKE